MGSAVPFDTLKSLSHELATKRDLREFESRLEAKIETSAAGVKVEILRWLVVTQIALAGFIFAAIKFVR